MTLSPRHPALLAAAALLTLTAATASTSPPPTGVETTPRTTSPSPATTPLTREQILGAIAAVEQELKRHVFGHPVLVKNVGPVWSSDSPWSA